jgi:hypothetical protein
MTEIEDLIREYGMRFLADQNALIEADLKREVGAAAMDVDFIKSSGIEVIWQYGPSDGIQHYRGLRREGKWIVDYQPGWPFEPDNTLT